MSACSYNTFEGVGDVTIMPEFFLENMKVKAKNKLLKKGKTLEYWMPRSWKLVHLFIYLFNALQCKHDGALVTCTSGQNLVK